MDAILIVGSEKLAEQVGKLLAPRQYAHIVHASSASKARRAVSGQAWGLIIISAPLPDENARLFVLDMLAQQGVTTLLLDKTAAESNDDGLITLVKPVNRVLFEQTLRVIGATNARLAALQEENRRLTRKVEEARLVGRAKCALVAYRQMTEEQAHHYIEKEAMDSRLPRKEVAKDILQIFEDV